MSHDAALHLESSAARRLGVRGGLAAAFTQARRWYVVYRQRRALLALDEALLKDIGLSRTDALAEGSKPFWRS